MEKKSFKEKSIFASIGLIFFNNRFKTLFLIICIAMLSVISLKNLKMDVSIEGFLKSDDPILVEYNKFRDEFDNDNLIVIGVRGDKVFDHEFLKKLKRLHDELENNVPYIDDITSLINVRNTRGDNDELIVEDLFEKFPKNEKEIEAIKLRTIKNDLYKNLVISQNLKTTAIVIKLLSFSPGKEVDYISLVDLPKQEKKLEKLSVVETGEAVEKAYEIIKKYESDDFHIYLSGAASIDHYLIKILPKDTRKFLFFTYLTVIILLGIIFRRISGVLLPLSVITLTLIFTLSLLAITGAPIKHPTQALPTFLLAVSVCYSVHVLALFYYYIDHGKDKKGAISKTLSHSGRAILLTGITTAAGLFSFSGSDVAPVGELGLFAGGGVFISILLSFVLLPALISFIPVKIQKKKRIKESEFVDSLLINIGSFATKRPLIVLGTTLLILIISVLSFPKIKFSHNVLKWLPANEKIRQDTEFLDKELKGTVSMEIIIDTKEDNQLYDPAFLKKIESVAKEIELMETKDVYTGKAWSIVEIIKETNKALHSNKDNFYKIPNNRELCAQELFLFSNSGTDDLEDFTDSGFSKARISVKLPYIDAIGYSKYISEVEALLKENFPNLSITTTGLTRIYSTVIAKAISSMGISYLIAFSAITILMIILIGELKLGLISMIPNLFPIVVVVGLTGILSIPFSMFIMLIGNIVMGLAVDDTIHFMHNYKKYKDKGYSCEKAVENTLLTSGRAMLVTSLILASAFFIYMLSTLNNLTDFGILSGVAIILALLSDFFIAPALMKVLSFQGEGV